MVNSLNIYGLGDSFLLSNNITDLFCEDISDGPHVQLKVSYDKIGSIFNNEG